MLSLFKTLKHDFMLWMRWTRHLLRELKRFQSFATSKTYFQKNFQEYPLPGLSSSSSTWNQAPFLLQNDPTRCHLMNSLSLRRKSTNLFTRVSFVQVPLLGEHLLSSSRRRTVRTVWSKTIVLSTKLQFRTNIPFLGSMICMINWLVHRYSLNSTWGWVTTRSVFVKRIFQRPHSSLVMVLTSTPSCHSV